MWRDTTLTIVNGQAASPALDLAAIFPAGKLSLLIIAPGTLPETVTVRVAKATGDTHTALQSGAQDITLPAGKATQLDPLVAGSLQLVAGGNVGGDRAFQILATPAR